CPHCHGLVRDGDAFCSQCGTRLQGQNTTETPIDDAIDQYEAGDLTAALRILREELVAADARRDVAYLVHLVDVCRQMVQREEHNAAGGAEGALDAFHEVLLDAERCLNRLDVETAPPRLKAARKAFAGGDLSLTVELLHHEILASDEAPDRDAALRVFSLAGEMKESVSHNEERAFHHVLAAAARRLDEGESTVDSPRRAPEQSSPEGSPATEPASMSAMSVFTPAFAPPTYSLPAGAQSTNGFAIASLVLGILWLYWIGSVLALVFGYVAKGQIDRSGGYQGGRGLAIAGIVLGWIGVGV